MSRNPISINAKMNFHIHLTHVAYGIFATPIQAISTPLVGVIMLVKPSPNWNANTVVCRLTLIRSANCAIIGIVNKQVGKGTKCSEAFVAVCERTEQINDQKKK